MAVSQLLIFCLVRDTYECVYAYYCKAVKLLSGQNGPFLCNDQFPSGERSTEPANSDHDTRFEIPIDILDLK